MTVAAIDAGTTGVRCSIIDLTGKVLGIGRESWYYITPIDLEIAKEFDPEHFWHLTCKVIKKAIKTSGVKPSDILSVATTSQRHGCVFVNKEGKEVYCGPNIDARGAMTQYIIEEALGEKYHEITGCWPPLMFSPARLSWFEEEEPEIFESIAHILPLNDWITYRLGNIFVTDSSAGSGTGFMDIRTSEWSDEVADAVGIDTDILPEIQETGTVVGEVTAEAHKACGLPKGLPIAQGGADTHCALLASNTLPGEIVVVAGSTAPVMMIIDDLYCDPTQKIWTGCHMIPGQWVLESNATLTGAYLEWVVRLLCERANEPENCKRATLNNLDEILEDIPPGSNETFAALGPSIMDCQQITDIKQAKMVFPQPALPQVIPLNSARMIHAVLENIAYAVRGNCAQLEAYRKASCFKTIGGMTQSRVWPDMLANVLGQPVNTPLQPEGSLLGAAVCAAKGADHYPKLMDAAKAMVQWKPPSNPDYRADLYKSYFSKWSTMFCEGE
ncbi:MAG: FGGY family carbohydrate kinase [Candidatus Thorarchaeota archaeon]|nr:FGGY family carbohydrate kinase [Candidatus Thorarchaeota archaeon]